METQIDFLEFINGGKIQNELDLERALVADRKLRLLSRQDQKYKEVRKQLRGLIEQYEEESWSAESTISEEKLRESDVAEMVAEQERLFVQRRRGLILKKLKRFGLKQQDLGKLLGYQSKSYISEKMNGLSPFTLKDLVVINRVLKISLSDLVPPFLSEEDSAGVREAIKEFDNPNLRLSKNDLAFA